MPRLSKLPFALKFGLAISLLTVGMTTISVSYLYAQMHQLLVRQTASRLKDVGQTGSFLFDQTARTSIERLEASTARESHLFSLEELAAIAPGETAPSLADATAERLMASAEFQQLVQILRRIGEASRDRLANPQTRYDQPGAGQLLEDSDNLPAISAYLMVEIPQSPDHQVVKFVADGLYEVQADWPGNPIGNLYRIPDRIPQDFFAAAFEGKSQIAPHFYQDEFGNWLTAVVPIKTPEGEVIALLGLDLDASQELSQIQQLMGLCIGAVLVSLVLSVLLAIALARWLGPPLQALQVGAERVRRRDYSTLLAIQGPSQVQQLAHAFNAMVQEIRRYATSLENQNQTLELRVQERTQTLQQTLEALQRAEAKYRSIFENSVTGIFQMTSEGQYLSANPALANIYGYHFSDDLLANLSQAEQTRFVHPEDRQQLIEQLVRDGLLSNFEYQSYQADQTVIWVSQNTRPVRNEAGQLLYYEGSVVDISQRKTAELALRREQQKSEMLLLNILPSSIAEQLKQEQRVIAESFENVTVLFADIVGFTPLANRLDPIELVACLNRVFSTFDEIADQLGLEKIKTIGDAYMVAGGLPLPRADHAEAIAEMALAMQAAMPKFKTLAGDDLEIRIGINTGVVVAGVIGIKKFIYDLWGDAVNVASRMESHSRPGWIQVTESTYAHLKDQYRFERRGEISVKGRGSMVTYWLLGPQDEA